MRARVFWLAPPSLKQSPELIAAIAQWQKVDVEYIATYGPARRKLARHMWLACGPGWQDSD